MNNEEKMVTNAPENEDDVILPEDYNVEDLFDEPSGDDENLFGKEDTVEGFGGEDDGAEDPAPEGQPEEQEPEEENGVVAEGGEDNAPAPAQQQESQGFRFQYGGVEKVVKEADVPELYRKAEEHGALSAQLAEANEVAKSMGFADIKAMMATARDNYRNGEVQRLVNEGMHEESAKDLVERRMQEAKTRQTQQLKQTPEQPQQGAQRRNFAREMDDLVQSRPDLKEHLENGGLLPQEVVNTCVRSNIPLRVAYAEYEAKEARANAERIRQENEILKQNEQNAKKAPVKSVTAGGGVKSGSKDAFLEGFEADN